MTASGAPDRRRSVSSANPAPLGRLAFALCALLVAASVAAPAPSGLQTDPLILISLDGFRHDYVDLWETPNLDRLVETGVRADGLIPAYPSKTFPSHYTIVTGLHPIDHGIVSNNMRDPQWPEEFHLSAREQVMSARWWGGEPIWMTVERQGGVAATMFWPGSEAPIGGSHGSHWRPFDTDLSFESRVDTVLAWLDLPEPERPSFISLYFEEPNEAGHEYGPVAPETGAAVRLVDRMVGDLLAGLEARQLLDSTNLVVVSDHGMMEVVPERTIVLDDFVSLRRGELFETGALVQIFPEPGREQEIFEALDGAHPHLTIYRPHERPQEMPGRFHLDPGSGAASNQDRGSNGEDDPPLGFRRLPPILGIPDPGWEAVDRAKIRSWRGDPLRGDHGWDPTFSQMHGLFIASGPAFRSGVRVPALAAHDVYNLMTAALGVRPAPNAGDPERIEAVLVQEGELGSPSESPRDWLLAFVDVETTGLVPGYHEMIDAGIIVTDLEGREVDRWFERIMPAHPERVSPEAEAINGFDRERWERLGALEPRAAAGAIADFLVETAAGRRLVPVAYNSAFDAAFLDHLFRSAGRSWRDLSGTVSYHFMDVPSMAWSLGFRQLFHGELPGALGLEEETTDPLEHTGISGAELDVAIYRALLARGLDLDWPQISGRRAPGLAVP